MEIEVTGNDRVAVVAISGRIDAYTAPEVEEHLAHEVEKGRNLVVDLGAADYISSAGLRVLIALAKRSLKGDLALRLCCLQPQVLEVFDIAGFTKLFQIRDTADAAVQELSAT